MLTSEARDLITGVLTTLGYNTPQLVNLLLSTMGQESQLGKYETQLGSGIAKGIFQCENATYQDIYNNFLSYHQALKTNVDSYNTLQNPTHTADDLVNQHQYAVAIASCSFIRHSVPHINDNANDPGTMYHYYKLYYNSSSGAATYLEFLKNWNQFGIAVTPVAIPSPPLVVQPYPQGTLLQSPQVWTSPTALMSPSYTVQPPQGQDILTQVLSQPSVQNVLSELQCNLQVTV